MEWYIVLDQHFCNVVSLSPIATERADGKSQTGQDDVLVEKDSAVLMTIFKLLLVTVAEPRVGLFDEQRSYIKPLVRYPATKLLDERLKPH